MVTMTAASLPTTLDATQEAPPSDIACGQYVFCAGMPRSGSTWQYQIVSHLLEQYRGGVRGGFLEHVEDFERIAEQTAGRTPWLTLKTHNGHLPYAQALHAARALAVYSYRDLRDVAFSLMHKMHLSFDEVVHEKFLLEQCLNDHLFWTVQPNVLCQRYETIISDPTGSVREIAAFLNISLTDADAARLADLYSLEANRARAQQLTRKLRDSGVDLENPRNAVLHDEHSQLHWNHIRQGRIGGWRDEATPEQLVALTKLCGGWLLENGYEQDASWVLPGVAHLTDALDTAKRELQAERDYHAQLAHELNELKTFGPLAQAAARTIQKVVDCSPRVRRLLKSVLCRAGFKMFKPDPPLAA
jgi:hypothetical protein